MGKFEEDLIKGEKMENKAIDILNKNWFNVIKNPDKKGMDLLLLENWIEIKFDEYAQYSWNFYIEFECNWNPSWIFKKEQVFLKYWGHSDWKKLFLLDGKRFKRWVSDKIIDARENWASLNKEWYMVVEKWWNWWRTKWLVLKVDLLKKQAIKEYNINIRI